MKLTLRSGALSLTRFVSIEQPDQALALVHGQLGSGFDEIHEVRIERTHADIERAHPLEQPIEPESRKRRGADERQHACS